MNKKGGVLAETFANFVFIPIAIILLIVIFITFLFILSDGKPEIRSLQTNVNTLRLITLLRAPVSTQDISGVLSVSDLIIYSVKNNNYNLLEQEIKSKLDLIYNKNNCPGSWKILGHSVGSGNELFSIGLLRSSELSSLDYRTFFVKKGVLIFTGVDVDAPAFGTVVLPIGTKNMVNLTLNVGC